VSQLRTAQPVPTGQTISSDKMAAVRFEVKNRSELTLA